MGQEHYEDGWDQVVEAMDDNYIKNMLILDGATTREEALSSIGNMCELWLSRALDCREGEDTDSELDTWKRFQLLKATYQTIHLRRTE